MSPEVGPSGNPPVHAPEQHRIPSPWHLEFGAHNEHVSRGLKGTEHFELSRRQLPDLPHPRDAAAEFGRTGEFPSTPVFPDVFLAVQVEDLDPLVEDEPQFAATRFDLQQIRQAQQAVSTTARAAAGTASVHPSPAHPTPAHATRRPGPRSPAPAPAAAATLFFAGCGPLHHLGGVVAFFGVEFPIARQDRQLLSGFRAGSGGRRRGESDDGQAGQQGRESRHGRKPRNRVQEGGDRHLHRV